MSDEAHRAAVARAQHWPDLTYWYRLPFSELLEMPNAVRRLYEESLPRLKAETLEQQINAAAFPHMKADDQKKLLRRLDRATGRDQAMVEVPTSEEDQAMRAARAGIGIEMV